MDPSESQPGYSKSAILEAVLESAPIYNVQLKEKQIEAITSFVEGHDVFVSLPTGFGKSTIYAILPAVFDRLRS